jgi:hypothetical protein
MEGISHTLAALQGVVRSFAETISLGNKHGTVIDWQVIF